MAWAGDWADVDVLVVDAADEERAGDQFPGVAVVRRARAEGAPGRPTIVVVTGHYLHDLLRHRMAAAGADFYFLRSDLRSADALLDVVLHPERHRRGVPPVARADVPGHLGLGQSSDVEAFVGWVEASGAGPELTEGAPRRQPRSRRWSRLRRDQEVPSVRQLARLWEWAARLVRPPD